jgi:uncharacterized protein YhaN
MRIDDLNINGFGHFLEQPFGPFESPITVFCGPNEAGKTTLLAFIRTALFGFPRVGRDRHYPALRGGQHGGLLHFRDDAGRRYQLERGERSFALRDESGRQLDQADLDRLLGHASRDMFESVFAFGIGELQQLDSLDGGEAARHIYAAGMGAARLPAALTSLAKGRDELFKPGGKNPEISKKLRELEQVDEAIRECAGDAARFAALHARREALDGEIEHARGAAVDRAAVRAAFELQHTAWPDWSELAVRREHLAARLPGRPLPENALTRLEALESAITKAREELATAEQRAVKLRTAANIEVPGAELLPHREAVAALTRRLGDAEHSVKDLRTRTGELRQAEATLASDLAALGPRWSAESVPSFDTSFSVRTALREHEQRLKDAADGLRGARAASAQAERALVSAEQAHTSAQARLEALGDTNEYANVDRRREAIRFARARLEVATRAADRAAFLEQAAPLRAPAAAAAPEAMRPRTPVGLAIALVVSAGGLALGGLILLASLTAGAAITAVVTWDALRRRPRRGSSLLPEPSSALSDAREAEAAAFASLAQSAEALGLDHISSQALDALEDALSNAIRLSLARAHAIENEQDQARDLQATQLRRDDASSALAESETTANETRTRWGAWLEAARLPADLSAQAALDLLARIEAAKQQAAGISALRERIDKIRADIASFRDLLSPVAEAANIGIESDESLFPAAELIIKRSTAAERAATDRDGVRSQLQEATEALAGRERRLANDECALAALLDSAGTADADAFRRAAKDAQDRADLGADLRRLEISLVRLCGSSERVVAIGAALGSTDMAQIELGLSEADKAGKAAGDALEALISDHARIGAEIQRLDSGERASQLHAQRAELMEDLRVLARKWATLTIAQRLLERAREQYQQQRQPAVVASAQDFFTTVTGGRYQRIVAQIGEQALSVHTADGRTKSPADLSRGTREQLYLALRFGLIRQFNEQAMHLPVIVDDILVNFDDDRAARAAQAFVELSRTNQVLVFTCHPSTAALFKSASKSTQVVDLSGLLKPQAPRLL